MSIVKSVKTIWECSLSPRLFKYRDRTLWYTYEANFLERWGDHVINSFSAIWSFSLYALPFIATFIYRRSYSTVENAYTLTKIVAGASAVLIASLALRGFGRADNPIYKNFIETLKAAQATNDSSTVKDELMLYDFEFWAWPEDYRVTTKERLDGTPRIIIQKSSSRAARNEGRDLLLAVPCKLISYVVANTIALKLMYPGSMTLINMAMKSTLLQGRMDLIDLGGVRSKIITYSQLTIDVMFIDRRKMSYSGEMLVITCEGNCGFYETGLMATPLKRGYSVLGWNHPGFGGSTGSPFPGAEIDAIDAVMKFAIKKLAFPEEKIILYGWSIGGFTSTWAAMNYPNIHSLVLDATFDDVLPLATARMPAAIDGLVRTVIREYLNLNVAEQLKRYNGRVMLIRRTNDEIMCTPTSALSDNRANALLTKLLMHRYPMLFTNCPGSLKTLSNYLKYNFSSYGRDEIHNRTLFSGIYPEKNSFNENLCIRTIKKYAKENDSENIYPSNLGEDCECLLKQNLVIYLACKYLICQESQHCSPLSIDKFELGWYLKDISTVEEKNTTTQE